MTLAIARKAARLMGMSLLRTSYQPQVGEYRVNFLGGSEASAVYETSVDAALDTARAMALASWRHAHKDVEIVHTHWC